MSISHYKAPNLNIFEVWSQYFLTFRLRGLLKLVEVCVRVRWGAEIIHGSGRSRPLPFCPLLTGFYWNLVHLPKHSCWNLPTTVNSCEFIFLHDIGYIVANHPGISPIFRACPGKTLFSAIVIKYNVHHWFLKFWVWGVQGN